MHKLSKICSGWLDPEAIGDFGQYPDELKIKRSVLLEEFPDLCLRLEALSHNQTCAEIKRAVQADGEALEVLLDYARKNLLWLNVYVKVRKMF